MFLCFSALAQDVPDDAGDLVDRGAFVAAVLDANAGLAAAQHEADAAEARTREAGNWAEPALGFSLAPLSLGAEDVTPGYAVSLSQVLPLSGVPGVERDIARTGSVAAGALLQIERLDRATDASRAFAEWQAVHDERRILDQQILLLDDLTRSVRAAYTSTGLGLGAVLGVESDRVVLEQQSLELDARTAAVLAEMNRLLHRDPRTPLPRPVIESRPADDGGGDPTALPDVVLAGADVDAASLEARAAKRRNVPDPTLMASYETMWMDVEHRLMIGVEVDLPLQPGRRRASVDEQEALLAASQSRLDAVRDEAAARLAAANARWEAARARESLQLERGIPLAEQRLDAERSAFQAGQGELASLLDAARRLLDARLSAVEARADAERTWADLQRAAGRLDLLLPSEGGS